MAEHGLLVIEDGPFYELLQRELVARGFDVHYSADAEEGLGDIVRLSPDVVFIPVDLPDSAGFGLFTRVRALSPRVRVVMVTGTLPPGDLLLHQKLKIHADLYLDKRTLTTEELEDGIERVLAGPDGEPIGERSLEVSLARGGDNGRSEWLAELIGEDAGDDIASALSVLREEQAYSAGGPPAASPDGETGPGASLRERQLGLEVERLREELEEAQRAARSTPFSEDFLSLHREMGQKRAEITRLKGELIEREHSISSLRKILDQVRTRTEHMRASDLAAAEERHAQDRERLLAAEEKRLQVALENAEREREQAIEEARIEHERLRKIDAEQRHSALEELRGRMERALDDAAQERESAIDRLQQKHADERRRVIAAERAHLQRELESARASGARALDELRAANSREIQDLRIQLEGTVAEAQREITNEREGRLQETQLLKQLHQTALEQAREEHAGEIAMLRAKQEASLAECSRNSEQTIADRLSEAMRGSKARIEALTQQHQAIVEQLAIDHADELRGLKEEHERELARADEQALARSVDPAELERLRHELAGLQAELDRVRSECESREAELENAREEIAALEAMIQETFRRA